MGQSAFEEDVIRETTARARYDVILLSLEERALKGASGEADPFAWVR
jgi:hypothetical protein